MSVKSGETLPEGAEIGGYRILRKIGEGGMGTVYMARQLRLEREVALKLLHRRLVKRNKEFIGRFLREAALAAKLNHANVVQVIDAGENQGVYFMAMEMVEGSSVQDLLKAGGAFPENVVLEVVRQSAEALAAAWRHKLIHRDIKPDNLILTRDGVVKVADFGLAKNTAATTQLTQAGILMGTPAYISPEQVQGAGAQHASDIYSLGITAYEMAVGVKPFRADSVMALLMKHVMESVPDPRDANPTLSEAFTRLVSGMTAKEPTDRLQQADDVVACIAGMHNPPDGRKVLGAFLQRRSPTRDSTSTGKSSRTKTLLAEARELASQKDFDTALSLLKPGRHVPRDGDSVRAVEEKTRHTEAARDRRNKRAVSALHKALQLADEGRRELAEKALSQVANTYADTPEADRALHRLSELRRKSGVDERFADVRRALARSDTSGARKALTGAREAHKSDPSFVSIEKGFLNEIRYQEMLEKGRALQARGQCEDGLEAFQRARELFDRKEARVGVARMRHKVYTERARVAREAGQVKKELKLLRQAAAALEAEGITPDRQLQTRIVDVQGTVEKRRAYNSLLKDGKGFEAAGHWSMARMSFRNALDIAPGDRERTQINQRLAQIARREDRSLEDMLKRAKQAAAQGRNAIAADLLRAYLSVRKADPSARQLLEVHAGLPDGVTVVASKGGKATTVTWRADGAAMVCVPAGPFIRGARDGSDEEGPAEQVEVSAFLIDREPVSNARYGQFLEWQRTAPDPHLFCHPLEPPGKSHRPEFWDDARWHAPEKPVVGVDWFDAWAYAAWAGKALPTEAQWEKAARGPAGRTYPWGESPPKPDRCNFFDAGLGCSSDPRERASGVSPYGALDMCGNVLEWCADFFLADFYKRAASKGKNPVNIEDTPKRSLRGGAWISVARAVRASFRDGDSPLRRNNYIGFRCATGPDKV